MTTRKTRTINWLDWGLTYGIPAAVLAAYNAHLGNEDVSVRLAIAAVPLGVLLVVAHRLALIVMAKLGLEAEVLLQTVARAALSCGAAVLVGQLLT